MENKKIVDMEIGSQAFSKDGNWQVTRRFKIIEEGKQPKYRYLIKCLKWKTFLNFKKYTLEM